MASPVQDLFHLVVCKNSLASRESFKASSSRTAIAARFQRQGGQPRVVELSLLESKLLAGAQVSTFQLPLPRLFLPFCGQVVGMGFPDSSVAK